MTKLQKMKIIIKMMCLFFLLACTKDEINTFEHHPFYLIYPILNWIYLPYKKESLLQMYLFHL